MATARTPSGGRRFFGWLRRSWRRLVKTLVVLIFALFLLAYMLDSSAHMAERATACFAIALICVSMAYLIYVSSRLRVSVSGAMESGDASQGKSAFGRSRLWTWRRRISRRKMPASVSGGSNGTSMTFEVKRLGSRAAKAYIANDALLPVLRAQVGFGQVYEAQDEGEPGLAEQRQAKMSTLWLPARSEVPIPLSHRFDHVGVFLVDSAGVRMWDLLGLFSSVRGFPGQWRVRVVPNLYAIPRGIPRERWLMQTSLGLPDSPADALDFDRVRDYRPGDPLKTIHWKLVAHGQGELYTKLFETATTTKALLVVDPYGPEDGDGLSELSYHLYDTMLEGGFSLLEYARQNGIAGCVRFLSRDGVLVETRWQGPSSLGTFVESARRPVRSREALAQAMLAVESLRDGRAGYVLYATSCLAKESVQGLIACRLAGVPLLVVHALPSERREDCNEQCAFDERLRDAGIAVIAIPDGSQIVREVEGL